MSFRHSFKNWYFFMETLFELPHLLGPFLNIGDFGAFFEDICWRKGILFAFSLKMSFFIISNRNVFKIQGIRLIAVVSVNNPCLHELMLQSVNLTFCVTIWSKTSSHTWWNTEIVLWQVMWQYKFLVNRF